ncbi:MAG: pteridine reductase [Gammaproteobacteria bacterium]|nr:pteridine reductase [Gammaproteobacteria bacterium]
MRIGAEITRTLHAAGMDTVIHYRNSKSAAVKLQQELEHQRPDSTLLLQADLTDTAALPAMLKQIQNWRGQLDLLVNNASSFYPTPLGECSMEQWDELMGSNLKAPFFLAQTMAPMLKQNRGSIINLVDIHAKRPLAGHAIYSIAKAGNAMMVKALARELGPEIRVNGIAPGIILWPEADLDESAKSEAIARTALKNTGHPDDIARTLLFLARNADYITGQIITVDGGRTLQQ